MSKQKNGGPAFPIPGHETHDHTHDIPVVHAPQPGMSLRDYFAAEIAAGDAAAQEWDPTSVTDYQLLQRAKFYYRVADAMLKARDA